MIRTLIYILFVVSQTAAVAAETPAPRDCRYLMMSEPDLREALRGLFIESQKQTLNHLQMSSVIEDLKAAANALIGQLQNLGDPDVLQAFTTVRKLKEKLPRKANSKPLRLVISDLPVATRITDTMGRFRHEITSVALSTFSVQEEGNANIIGYLSRIDVSVRPELKAEFERNFHQRLFSHYSTSPQFREGVREIAARRFDNRPLAKELGIFEAIFVSPAKSFGLYVEEPFDYADDDVIISQLAFPDFISWLDSAIEDPELYLLGDILHLSLVPRKP